MKKLISIFLVVIMIVSSTGCETKTKNNVNTDDFKEKPIGSEMPRLLYGNEKYCIINMYNGGIVLYDFEKEEIIDRISYEELEKVGFKYPIPIVSKDPKIIYITEDVFVSKTEITYSYNLETKELKEITKPEDIGQDISLENNINLENVSHEKFKEILSDGLAYGWSVIKLDKGYIMTRVKKGGSLLSDVEILKVKEDMTIEKIFPIVKN